ncbi:MAG TPA: hypothetical protein DIS79_05430 [Bacteroidetes bacterium]|nr:hypothetical protein [Bacteroidota bacterium]HRK05843.1 hypothetical protein [Chlorobiota bacterium]
MSNHSDWIQDLLDGELDSMHEQKLFAELSVNGDLRTELRQQLAIRSAVHHDRMGLVPPAALTNSVFAGLGFATPLAGAAASAAAGGSALMQWLGRLGLPILSAIAAAGLTLAVSEGVGSTSVPIPTAVTSTDVVTPPVTGAALPTNVTQPEITSAPVTVPRASSRADLDRIREFERLNSQLLAELRDSRDRLAKAEGELSQRSSPSLATTVEEAPEEPRELAVVPISSIDLSTTITLQRETATPMYTPRTLSATSDYILYPSFLIQLRGLSASNITNVSADPDTRWYDHIGVALMYQLSDRSTFGVEFGSEPFPQVFEGSRSGQVIRYEQQPSSMWAGAMYRHTFPRLGTTSFAPFGQALIGGTKFGPLGRATVGLQYAPTGPLSFILGLEGTMMGYQFQDRWFTSSKFGLTYGLAVRL